MQIKLPWISGPPKSPRIDLMKKLIALFVIVTGLGNVNMLEGAELFNDQELALSFYGSYVDKHDSKVAPGAGVTYFFTRNLGVGAFTFWENYDGTFFDNISAEAYFRWPLDRLRLAPYGLAGIGYSFETEEHFGEVGVGAEFRLNERWGAFGDVRWQINGDTDNGVGVRFGVRFVF
jgi:outer membrane protein W